MIKRMVGLVAIIGGLLPSLVVHAGQAGPVAFDLPTLLATEFQAPASDSERQYLGLSKEVPFRLTQIKASVLMVEVFSMYCPICQAGAPEVNRLYTLIENDPKLRREVKIIGIGIGNTPYEVDVFRKKYGIAFPLVPDPESAIQKVTEQTIRTPTFVVLGRKDSGPIGVLKVHVGRIGNIEDFLGSISGR
jgi:hypothetical protein